MAKHLLIIVGLFFVCTFPVFAGTIPANPNPVTLTSTGSTTATATWSEPSGVYYYYVMISTSSTFPGWSGGLGGYAPRSSQNFTGLTAGTTYYAYVSSVNSSWEWNTPTRSNAATTTATSYTITYTAGSNGSLSGSTTQTISSGGSGSAVTAVPSAHYHFVNWSDNSTVNPRTDTNVTSNKSVTANFSIDTYTLSYTAGLHGSLTGATSQTVNYNNSGSAVTAIPSAHYHFVNWSDNSTANPRTDTNVTSNKSVTANFSIDTYTLSYSAGSHGSISGTATQTINYGSDGTAVTAIPDSGYAFSKWSDNDTNNPRTDIEIMANVTVSAEFIETGYVISNPPTNTTITLSSDNTTDVTSNGQTGSQTVVVGKTGSTKVATFSVSFTANRDWSNLTTLSDGTKSVFHYPGGYTSLPGHVGNSYSLMVRDLGGSRVRICPGASTLNEVTSGCSGEYFVSMGTAGVSKTTINSITYWVVAGLTASGGEDVGPTTNSAPLFNNGTFLLTIILVGVGSIYITSKQNRISCRQIH